MILSLIDLAIQEGTITQQQYRVNEVSILEMIDDAIFECAECGWTMPTSERSYTVDDTCSDCNDGGWDDAE
jgi:hypothetical protein